MDGIGKLEDSALPPQEAFLTVDSRTKAYPTKTTLAVRQCGVDNGMKTMHDFLVWYKQPRRRTLPSMPSIKQFAFYKQQNIDMFQRRCKRPGTDIAPISSTNFRRTPSLSSTRRNSDLHLLVKDNIVGGPAIIFHRYHEKGTSPRYGAKKTCRSIVGYDANALYPWALMQDMPTGWYTRRREERAVPPSTGTTVLGQMGCPNGSHLGSC